MKDATTQGDLWKFIFNQERNDRANDLLPIGYSNPISIA